MRGDRLADGWRWVWSWVPGFTWVQIFVVPRGWRWGHWWAVRGLARMHAFGPVHICTTRSDAVERGNRPGGEFYKRDHAA